MADQPERQYTDKGKIIGECEGRHFVYLRAGQVFPDDWGWVETNVMVKQTGWYARPRSSTARTEAFICDQADCGSHCDASGHATPGVLVLERALLIAHQRLAVFTAAYTRGDIVTEARATLAARGEVTK